MKVSDSMKDIKTKEKAKKFIKTLDKGAVLSGKLKDNLVEIKDKTDYLDDESVNEYSYDKLKDGANTVKVDKVVNNTKKVSSKMKERYIKKHEKKLLKKNPAKIKKNTSKTIKTSKNTIKTTKIAMERARQLAIKSAKVTAKGVKAIGKAIVEGTKAFISLLKSLGAILGAGGVIAVVIVVLICIIGLLCSSIFGIFFSSEKSDKSSYLMSDCITELNQDMDNRITLIENMNPHDEVVITSNKALWKDVLAVYTVKVSNGNNETDVMTIDNNKKQILISVFWDMNTITSEVKVEEYDNNTTIGTLKEVEFKPNANVPSLPNTPSSSEDESTQKKVLHIYINSKSVDEMKTQYSFSESQLAQFTELTSEKYQNLWSNVIYGVAGSSGEITEWKQKGMTWSDIKIGTTEATIGDIGCLVTSIAIQIKKSGVATNDIYPFNPGTFVIALNNAYAFDSNGNLSYAPISKVVPDFKYVGRVELKGKTKSEKLYEIRKYYEDGYYLVAEVKGATLNNQHWVAVDNVTNSTVVMLDPGSNAIDMWSQYDWNNTSQFIYFKGL